MTVYMLNKGKLLNEVLTSVKEKCKLPEEMLTLASYEP